MRTPQAASRRAEQDAERATIAASLQMTCPSWLVMWSRWRRTYTAFACFTKKPVIVDEAKVDAFLAHIRQVEEASRGEQVGRV